MKVPTTRFGELDVSEESVITFPKGLYGFEDRVSYCLINIEEEQPFQWLQSIDEPSLAFVVASPFTFFPKYDIEVDDNDIAEITGGGLEVPEVLCVVTISKDLSGITMNLRAPILLFNTVRLGRQIIINDPKLEIKAQLKFGSGVQG